MKKRGGANTLWLALQRGAVGELGLFELLDGLEMAINEWRVGERREAFGGLQLRVWARQIPLVFDAVGPTGVVAARDLADPIRGLLSNAGNDFGGEATR